MTLTRREMLSLSLAAVLWPMAQPAEAHRFVNRTGLRTGQFVWEPSQPEDGPVSIIVSLRHRLVHVYKAGVLIGISTCQVGHRGRRAPTGVFVIGRQPALTEGGQLSWSGMALHAENVRAFPAGRGCIRMPAPFARLLDQIVHPGALVILAGQRTEPMDVVYSGGLFPMLPVHEASGVVRTVAARPMPTPLAGNPDAGHVAVVISRASRSAVLLRDGVPEHVARVNFMQPNSRIGTHVYSLTGTTTAGDGLVWLAFGIGRSRREAHLVSWHGDELLDQISFEDRASALAFTRAMYPGATLIVTDEPSSRSKRQSPDDLILLSAQAPAARTRSRSTRRTRTRTARRTRRRRRQQTWASALLNSWR